jgi:uncharacterized protein
MATAYKTPGVYVEEITKFPPSVAEVETAIPAFIGYTEKAKKYSDGDLKNVPTRVTSLLEYEQYFGKGPAYSTLSIKLDDNNIPVDTDTTVGGSSYVLYDSMRLFYDNGGGACYIVSVGTLLDTIILGDVSQGLRGGLEQLKKYDEPTLILFPDAVALSKSQLGGLQQAALLQCETLGDRFTIMDIKDSGLGNTLAADVEDFRNNVGMNSLKYGAAYHPYLNSIFDKTFKFRDINKNIKTSGGTKTIKDLVKSSDVDENGVKIKDRLIALESVITDNTNISTGVAAFITMQASGDNLDAIFQSKYQTFISDTTSDANLKGTFNYLWEALLNVDGFLFDNSAEAKVKTKLITNADFLTSAKSYTTNTVQKYMQDLINLDVEALNPGNKIFNKASTYGTYSAKFKSDALKALVAGASTFIDAVAMPDKINQCVAKLREIYRAVSGAYSTITQMGQGFEDTQAGAIIKYIPFYNGILNTLNSKVTLLPPSGAMAGIYASVDSNRGVWKAPANVSVNSVNGISEFIDDSIQENLNVDPNAGKSVNAIRPFTGKGIIVWGSRTLAGNDNEWRYVPVRRFFSFVEESCKKSTSWAVFEPNDANTWARIRGQVDNFLNNLWRRGALAGAKPEHAYYVNCGIGITMTAQDILEGRLIIEVGMAAVRPAEFIVLRFSHKLQQS